MRRVQYHNEFVDNYTTVLHFLVEVHLLRTKKEIVRDSLVVVLSDLSLLECWQISPDLTLQMAVDLARSSKRVTKQHVSLQVESHLRGSCACLSTEDPLAGKFHGAL